MHSTIITFDNFKEFFSIPKHASYQLKDVNYKKTIISQKNLNQDDNQDTMVSWERVRGDRVLLVLDLLNYKITAHKLGFIKQSLPTLEWLIQIQRIMYNYLNNLDEKKSFYTPNYLYKHVTYSKSKPSDELLKLIEGQKMIGRLYSADSINCLSREIRFLLFSGEYVDYDIKNCHPTICLNYGQKNGLFLNGSLKNYIENRDEVLKRIEYELNESYSKNSFALFKSSEIPVKKIVLIIQNRNWDKCNTGSNTLNNLDADFSTIRDHLWSRFIGNEFLEYSGKVSARETIQDKKTTLQSLFFQSKETEHLFALKRFLVEKYKSHMKIQENTGKFKDYVSDTDKHVDLDAIHSLLMIPFFDGFYLRALDKKFMKKLPEHIKSFNMFYEKEHGIVFEEKEIKPDYTYFTKCPQKQKNFSSVTSFLRQTKNTLLVKRFIERLPRVDECLIKLRNLDITTSTYFQDVKQLNNEIKTHFIYICLTSGNNFDNSDDVKNYIKKILLIKNPDLKEILPIELRYNKYDSNLFVETE